MNQRVSKSTWKLSYLEQFPLMVFLSFNNTKFTVINDLIFKFTTHTHTQKKKQKKPYMLKTESDVDNLLI